MTAVEILESVPISHNWKRIVGESTHSLSIGRNGMIVVGGDQFVIASAYNYSHKVNIGYLGYSTWAGVCIVVLAQANNMKINISSGEWLKEHWKLLLVQRYIRDMFRMMVFEGKGVMAE
jgi:hypothetical protein